MSGALNSRAFDIDLTAQVPWFEYGKVRFDSVDVIMDNTMDVLAFAVVSARQTFNDSTWFSGSEARGSRTRMRWSWPWVGKVRTTGPMVHSI